MQYHGSPYDDLAAQLIGILKTGRGGLGIKKSKGDQGSSIMALSTPFIGHVLRFGAA